MGQIICGFQSGVESDPECTRFILGHDQAQIVLNILVSFPVNTRANMIQGLLNALRVGHILHIHVENLFQNLIIGMFFSVIADCTFLTYEYQ